MASALLAGSGLAVAAPDHDALSSGACPSTPQALVGVYRPGRLHVMNACANARGRVVAVSHKPDGDVHMLVNLDASYRGLLDQGNAKSTGGNLVVELMPRDAGHITEPHVGDQVRLVGAWTHDAAHGWNEIHPVWALSDSGGPWQRSGPGNGGDPAATHGAVAAQACRTTAGSPCKGYPATSQS